MNICFVLSEYANPQTGGIQRVVDNLQKGLNKLGHHCIILSKDEPCNNQYIEKYKYVLKNQNKICSEENILYASSLFSEEKIDVVIYAALHDELFELCLKIKRKNNIKIIATFHGCPDCSYQVIKDKYEYLIFGKGIIVKIIYAVISFLNYKYRQIHPNKGIGRTFKYVYDNSDAYVLLSNSFKRKFKQISKIESNDKLYAIGNPNLISEVSVNEKKNQIIYVGRIEFISKRVERIVKIWEKLYRRYPDWKLLLVGEGSAKQMLMTYCRNKGIKNIEFIGNVNPIQVYTESKIILLTSSGEGLPMVLIEALKFGCIPVAYNSFTSLSDIIEDGENGFMIKPFSPKMFIQKLCLLMNNKNLYEMMAEKAIQKSEKFDLEVISQEWNKLLLSL